MRVLGYTSELVTSAFLATLSLCQATNVPKIRDAASQQGYHMVGRSVAASGTTTALDNFDNLAVSTLLCLASALSHDTHGFFLLTHSILWS